MGSQYLEQQDELWEPLDGPCHQAVERDAVRAGLLGLLRGESAILTPRQRNGTSQPCPSGGS